MNDVLHKPFTMQAMADKLQAYLHAASGWSEAAPSQKPAPEPATVTALPLPSARPTLRLEDDPENPILEPAVTRQLLDMARLGGKSAVARIYRLYLENGPPALAEIDAALTSGDSARLGKAAHALKSMSLSLGAQRVAAGAGDMEKAARAETLPIYDRHRETIGNEIEQAYARIRLLIAAEGLDDAAPEHQASA